MTPISTTVPNPAPKPDREVALSGTSDARQQGTGRESGFGTVLRELSNAGTSAPADSDAVTPEPEDSEGDAAPAAAAVTAAPAPAAPSSAVTMLANLLSLAGPPAPATENTTAPSQDQARSVEAKSGSAAGNLSTSLLASTAKPARGYATGPTPTLDTVSSAHAEADTPRTDVANAEADTLHTDVANAEADTPRTNSANGLGAAAASVAVLGRAVHFKPVIPGGVPAPAAANAGPQEPVTATGAGPANPPRTPSESPALNAAGALKIPLPVRSEPESRRGSTAEAEPETEQPMILAPAHGRTVSAVGRALLASVGDRAPDSAPAAATRDGTGPAGGLPAGSLPLIATAIKEELERAKAAASQSRIHADPAANAIPDGPLRTLRIQLHPEDLGTVTVEMRLSNGQLETHLRASQPETAALLHRDTALLTDLLSHSTYQAEITVGQARPAESSAAPGGSSPSFTDGGARPGNEGSRSRQGEQNQAATRREGERTDEAVRPRDSGVYL